MEITAVAIQNVAANQDIIFNNTVVKGNCSIIHRPDSGLVTLRGMSSTQCRARFRVTFNGNIAPAIAATPIQVAITIDGEPVGSSTMIFSPAAAGAYGNVSSSIFIDVPKCCNYTIAVRNTSTQAINVQNANLIVERVA